MPRSVGIGAWVQPGLEPLTVLYSKRAKGLRQAGVASRDCGAGHTYAGIAGITWLCMLAATRGLTAPTLPATRAGDTR